MLPLRDNIAHQRGQFASTVLVAALLVLCLLSLRTGEGMPAGDLVQLLGDGLLLWLFGPSVEDFAGRARFLALCLLGGLAALGAAALIDSGARGATVAATGAAGVVLGTHLALYPRARLLMFGFVPFLFSLFEVPTLAVIATWLAEQIGLAAGGVVTPIGAGHLQWIVYAALLLLAAALLSFLARGRARPAAFGPS